MNDNYFEYTNHFIKYQKVNSNMIIGNPERKETLFTIAIPTYNRPQFLEKSLESALNQIDVEDYEIIIVDNDYNSILSEEVIKQCKDKRVYYYKNEENIGMFGNWNRCIELSMGKYITILNDDDWLSQDFLHTCLKYLNKDTDGLYFISNIVDYRVTNKNVKNEKNILLKRILNRISKTEKKLTLFDFFLGNKSGGTLGIILKTDYLKKLGGYNEDYFPSSDYVLHANYCNQYNVKRINQRMNYYRIQLNESCKQETLKKWEFIDYDIREYFIKIIGKNRKILNYLNVLIQHNRVEGLIQCWNYQTDYKIRHNIARKVFDRAVAIKYYLNI